jgi:hypothetical protein
MTTASKTPIVGRSNTGRHPLCCHFVPPLIIIIIIDAKEVKPTLSVVVRRDAQITISEDERRFSYPSTETF